MYIAGKFPLRLLVKVSELDLGFTLVFLCSQFAAQSIQPGLPMCSSDVGIPLGCSKPWSMIVSLASPDGISTPEDGITIDYWIGAFLSFHLVIKRPLPPFAITHPPLLIPVSISIRSTQATYAELLGLFLDTPGSESARKLACWCNLTKKLTSSMPLNDPS